MRPAATAGQSHLNFGRFSPTFLRNSIPFPIVSSANPPLPALQNGNFGCQGQLRESERCDSSVDDPPERRIYGETDLDAIALAATEYYAQHAATDEHEHPGRRMIRRISCGLKRDCSTGSNTAERGGSVVSGALIPCAIRHPPASIVQHTQRATRVTRIARRAKTGNHRGCRSLWPGVGDTEPERGGKGRNMLRY